MIFELKESEFFKCRGLLSERGQLEAMAIVENINPGRIFVDDIRTPSCGLIWLGNNDGFIFFGSEQNEDFNNELNGFIDDVIMPEAKKVQLEWFEGVGNHEKWNSVIERVFEHRQVKSWNQKVYTLQKFDYQSKYIPEIEKGYQVVKINHALFENRDNSITNIDFLQSKIAEFWSTPEQFFANGLGYCVVHKNEIVSACFSGFVVGEVHCIDIETIESHQGKQLAQMVAHSFVKECLENDQVPYWDCMEMNKPSVAVAEKIGFKNVFNYAGYYFSLHNDSVNG